MHITHSYIGTIRKPYRCLFFLLLEDYIEAQTHFARESDLNLERFARNLGDSAALVRPFTGRLGIWRAEGIPDNIKPLTVAELHGLVPFVGRKAYGMPLSSSLHLDAANSGNGIPVTGLGIRRPDAADIESNVQVSYSLTVPPRAVS